MNRKAITAIFALSAVLAISALAQAQSSTGQQAGLTNPGFEEPRGTEGSYTLVETMPGWKTTDKEFEIWSTGFLGVAAHEGTQFVELNAWIDGTLYQDSTGIQPGSVLEFTFAHRGRNGEDTMKLTITDLGADNSLDGGDDTVLFTREYTTGKDAWAVYDSTTEQKIKALGNTVRFAYGAISATGGNLGQGNLLDAANFGVGVVSETPPENAMKLDVDGGAFTFGYRTTAEPGFTEFPNTDSPHPGITRRNIKDGDYFSYAQNTRETEYKAQETGLVHYPAKAEGSGVLCPGINPGDVAIARFTAMDDGEYHFKITAELIEEDPTGAGVTIYVNGQAVAEKQLTGHLVPWSTSFQPKLTKGQFVDIAVDSGVDKNWEKDHVLVTAKAWTTGPAKRAPFVVSETTGNTAQFNAIAEFSLHLSARPSSKVTVPVASSDKMQGVPLQTELVFTAEDWQQPKRVSVRGTNNNVVDGKQDYRIVLGPAVSTDPKYHGLKPDDVALKGIELLLSPPEVLNGFLANEAIRLKPEIRYTGSNLLSFALTESPEGMTIDLSSGLFSWTPQKADEGKSHPVHMTVNDQTRFASLEFAVIVAKPTVLAVEVKNNTLRVVDESTSLKGMSITQLAGDNFLAQLNLGKVEANAVPETPEYVTRISDVFVVGGSFKGEVELRFPLPKLPAGVSPRDVSLYSLVDADFHGDDDHGKFWSPVGLDINHEGTAEAPVTAVKLAGLESFSVWGYTTPDAKNAAADNSSNAQDKDTTGTPSAPVTASITIVKKDGDNSKDYICSASQGTDTSTITVFNWGYTDKETRWNGVTLEELVSDLLAAQQWFADHKLGFDTTFTVRIEEMPEPSWLGYVTAGKEEARKTLHLNQDNSQSKNLMCATIVHEYFHHAQGHAKTKIGTQDLLIDGTADKKWLIEGTAQWFEDQIFDDLNSYDLTEAPGHRIAEVGINVGTGNGLKRPYQRFSFFKLLTTKHPAFESDFRSYLNVKNDDPSGIQNLTSKLNAADCNFGDHFGTNRAKNLETALAFYNYATQFKNDLSLLDADEPSTPFFDKPEFLFDQFPVSLDASNTATLVGVTNLPAAGAISFTVPSIAGTLPPGKVAELVVDSDNEVLVSITSLSSDFVGTNKIGKDQHSGFSTKKRSRYIYNAGDKVPELFVTLVNPSIKTKAEVKRVSFRINDRQTVEPVIFSPLANADVSNRVVTVKGEIPAAARTKTTIVQMTVNGITSEVLMSTDGKYSMQAVVALGQNTIKIEGFTGTTPTTAEKLITINGVESTSNERNALLASRAVFVLRWDTDKTDLDLYCTDKNDKTIWYEKNAAGPGNLDYDTRDGFGPEVVTYRASGADIGDLYTNGGKFDLDVDYFKGTLRTSFTLDIILNETEGDNRRVVQYKSKNSLSAGNEDDNGPKKSGSSRFNNIVKITCSKEGVCSLGSFDVDTLTAQAD